MALSLLSSSSPFHWPSLLAHPMPLCKMRKLSPRNLQNIGSLPQWTVLLKKKRGNSYPFKTDFRSKYFFIFRVRELLMLSYLVSLKYSTPVVKLKVNMHIFLSLQGSHKSTSLIAAVLEPSLAQCSCHNNVSLFYS